MKIGYGRVLFGAILTVTLGNVDAQDIRKVQFSGSVSDYSPSTISGGTWEIRGNWSPDISGSVSFSAALTMETSDYGITDSTQVDPANPSTRSPHTHHITLSNATVSYNTSSCPANSPATTGSGVMVTGTATISGNGAPAPFESKGASTLQICVVGGPEVEYSNVTLVFTGPVTTHFGPQAIHGVVKKVTAK